MAILMYRCLSCGGVHETSARPGGAVYLRCVVTREWRWHDPSRFLSAPAGGGSEAGGGARPRRAAPAKGRARKPAAKRAAPRRAARKPATRRVVPKRRKR